MLNKTNNALIFQMALKFIVILLLTCCRNISNPQKYKADSSKQQEKSLNFTFTSITELEFRNTTENNYNAPQVSEITDTIKLEKAFDAIGKTYTDIEKELAQKELCNSPRCLTTFEAYYPTLDLYLFYILDNHYAKASFVNASTNEMASGSQRFRGSYGVMSKDGLWIGLEREDCDNHLQIEICQTSINGAWTLFKFDFTTIDINYNEKTPMLWADKNTVYIATKKYDQNKDEEQLQYYSIKFKI